MDFYSEVIKQKKTVVNLPMCKSDDGRHFIELETFMLYLAKVEKQKIKELTKHIPKAYIKVVDVPNKGKVKYIDRLATGMITSQLNNYDLFKFTVARTNNKFDKYYPMLFAEAFISIHAKIGNMSMLSNDIGNIDKARNDLLHMNENNTELSNKEKASFYDDLHNLQVERRNKKTKFECLKAFKNFFESHNIKGSEIAALQGTINGLNNLSSKKIYNNRAITTESKKYLGSQNDEE